MDRVLQTMMLFTTLLLLFAVTAKAEKQVPPERERAAVRAIEGPVGGTGTGWSRINHNSVSTTLARCMGIGN